jgi:hypothetical protein
MYSVIFIYMDGLCEGECLLTLVTRAVFTNSYHLTLLRLENELHAL